MAYTLDGRICQEFINHFLILEYDVLICSTDRVDSNLKKKKTKQVDLLIYCHTYIYGNKCITIIRSSFGGRSSRRMFQLRSESLTMYDKTSCK